ncbi:MAG TPA: hypothetical protein VFD59_08995 [Nocardioidaceae bacterium]|nr:hypothetical protein [Nocardioidaceae bacterium]
MRFLRIALGAGGLALIIVGLVNLLGLGLDNLLQTGLWLVGGVVVHDGVFAVLVVGLGVLGARLLPRWASVPLAVGAIVLVTVTLAVLPTIGRFGALSDNPTLLDRPYGPAWWGFAALVGLGVALACFVARRRAHTKLSG